MNISAEKIPTKTNETANTAQIKKDADYWQKRRQFLQDNGYVVIEAAVELNVCQQAITAICQFMQIDPDDKSSWYKSDTLNNTGAVPMHHHPAFWQLRQQPGIYQAFKAILQQEDLWVTMDRASFKPPCRYDLKHYGNDANPMHWDYDFRHQQQEIYQGLVYLSDTQAEQGAFACLPQMYRDIVAGEFKQPQLFDQFAKNGLFLKDVIDFNESDLTVISAPAGSLVIFDSRLPHGGLCTHFDQPRFVQYISMYQAQSSTSVPEMLFQDREERIDCYQNARPPAWLRNWKGQQDPEPFTPQPLTPLGRKLVGLDLW